VQKIERAFRLLLRSKLNTVEALSKIRVELEGAEDIEYLVRFVETAERGIAR